MWNVITSNFHSCSSLSREDEKWSKNYLGHINNLKKNVLHQWKVRPIYSIHADALSIVNGCIHWNCKNKIFSPQISKPSSMKVEGESREKGREKKKSIFRALFKLICSNINLRIRSIIKTEWSIQICFKLLVLIYQIIQLKKKTLHTYRECRTEKESNCGMLNWTEAKFTRNALEFRCAEKSKTCAPLIADCDLFSYVDIVDYARHRLQKNYSNRFH